MPASLAERSRSDASLELGIIYQQPLTLSLSADLGEVSAIYQRPEAPVALLVLAHGAGAGMQHEHMQSLADAFAEARIASLRFNFPFMESSRKPPNSLGVCLSTLAAAVTLGASLATEIPLYIGGHSFGGRMASHYVEQSHDARIGTWAANDFVIITINIVSVIIIVIIGRFRCESNACSRRW